MAKPELGTKRLCGSCGAKFYDLMRNPIVCPKCETVFKLAEPAKASPEKAPPEVETKDESEDEAAKKASVEVVSLEELDEGGDEVATEDDDVAAAESIPEIENVDDGAEEGGNDFLENEDEEDSGDVSKILADVPSKSDES